MSKLEKFVRSPGVFWRDYFNKKYPEKIGSNFVLGLANGHRMVEHPAPFNSIDLYPVDFPIDVVYSWVDGSDDDWQRKMERARRNVTERDRDGISPSRFISRDELKYSLRSIAQYGSWVNHIYIVTDNQRPSWLTDNSDVTVIDHTEIIPKAALPTFNSHVIEAHLHRIPGLSERYIYFNDDVFLTRPVPREYFFSSNGVAHLFPAETIIPGGPINDGDSDTIVAAKNVRDLIASTFGKTPNRLFEHTFHPQLASVNHQIYERFLSEIEAFLPNRFRGDTDLAIPTILFPHYAYLSGAGDLRATSCVYFDIGSAEARRRYEVLLAARGTEAAPYSMCLNDVRKRPSDGQASSAAIDFLETYFPVPSKWEKCDASSPAV